MVSACFATTSQLQIHTSALYEHSIPAATAPHLLFHPPPRRVSPWALPPPHHRPVITSLRAVTEGSNVENNDDDATLESLGQTLRGRWNDLLFEEVERRHDGDSQSSSPQPPTPPTTFRDVANLTPNDMAKGNVLLTRIPNLGLRRTRVGPSTLPGAGRGLFATRDISKGEVLTCYPGDAVLYEEEDEFEVDDGDDDEGFDDENEDEDEDEDDEDDEEEDDEEEGEEVILWGTHVKTSLQWEDDAVFDGGLDDSTGEQTRPLTDYILAVCDNFSVMGLPTLDADAAYAGHFANDAGGHHFFGNDLGGGVEQALSAYVIESVDLSNAMHRSCEDCHMMTVATRDIAKDDEVFVTYGPDYWMEHVSFD